MSKISLSKNHSRKNIPDSSKNKGYVFQEAFDDLSHSLGALIYASPIYRNAADNIAKSALRDFAANIASVTSIDTLRDIAELLGNYADNKNVEEKTFDIDGDAIEKIDFVYNIQQLHPRLKTDDLLGKSLVLIMISQFDIFEANIIKGIYNAFPKKVDNSKHTITFSELTKFDSIEEARNHVIDSEIDSILRGSHTKHINAITEIGDFKIDRSTALWKSFIEVTERRNLFAHTDGVVTKQYINVLKENGAEIPDDIKIGTSLIANQNYVEHCYECLIEMAICTTHVAWRKIYSDENRYAEKHIYNFIETLMKQRKFSLASNILDAFMNKMIAKWQDDIIFKQLLINLAHCYKETDMNDKCKVTLNKTNWSSSDPKFRLQKFVIEENYSEAVKFMKKVSVDEEFPASMYIHNPIFEKFIETPEFRESFQGIFGYSLDDLRVRTVVSAKNILSDVMSENSETPFPKSIGETSEVPRKQAEPDESTMAEGGGRQDSGDQDPSVP